MSATAAEVFDRIPHPKLDVELSKGADPSDDRLLSIQGRIGVWRYNARWLLCILAGLAGGLIVWMASSSESGFVRTVIMVPALAVMVMSFVVYIYTAIKRIHDLGRSGWYFLVTFIPIVGALWSLYYALVPGSGDDNQFGEQREATKADKVLGVLGLFLVISINILYLIPMGD